MEKKTKIPLLRFPEFKDEWATEKLGDISTFLDGRRKPIKEADRAKIRGDYPYYGASGIIDYVNDYIFDEDIILLGEDGENIVSRNLPLAFVVKGKSWINNHAHVIKPHAINNIHFIAQVLENVSYEQYNTGTAQPKLNQQVCRGILINITSSLEQQKIAIFLTAVDDKIQQLTRKKALLEKYKKAVMQKIFHQEIRFKDVNGNDYPNWTEKKLSDIFTFFPTNSYSRSLLNYDDGEVKNIHYGDIHTKFKTNFDIKKENVPFLNSEIEAGKIPLENYLKEGDLIIADASEDYKDVGKSIEVINLDNQRVVAGLHTYIGRDLNGLTYLGFKGYMMQNHEVRLQIMKMATGSSVLGITKGNLGKIKINIPSLKEQKKIVEFLTAIDVKINFIAKQLEKTQSFKKGLLQQMFV